MTGAQMTGFWTTAARRRFCDFAFNSRSALERHGFKCSPSWSYLELMTEN